MKHPPESWNMPCTRSTALGVYISNTNGQEERALSAPKNVCCLFYGCYAYHTYCCMLTGMHTCSISIMMCLLSHGHMFSKTMYLLSFVSSTAAVHRRPRHRTRRRRAARRRRRPRTETLTRTATPSCSSCTCSPTRAKFSAMTQRPLLSKMGLTCDLSRSHRCVVLTNQRCNPAWRLEVIPGGSVVLYWCQCGPSDPSMFFIRTLHGYLPSPAEFALRRLVCRLGPFSRESVGCWCLLLSSRDPLVPTRCLIHSCTRAGALSSGVRRGASYQHLEMLLY